MGHFKHLFLNNENIRLLSNKNFVKWYLLCILTSILVPRPQRLVKINELCLNDLLWSHYNTFKLYLREHMLWDFDYFFIPRIVI